MAMAEKMILKSTLAAHGDWVTSIATPAMTEDGVPPNIFLAGSRDGSVLVWEVVGDVEVYARPRRSLTAHSHFVSDVMLSADSKYALSSSWDGTMRLWNLATGDSVKTFIGHAKDVLTVSFNPENTKILSGSRDNTIKLWNVLGHAKAELDHKLHGHSHWVSCVRYSPNAEEDVAVSAGWDKLVKVWGGVGQDEYRLRCNLIGHTAYVNTVTVSPDGSLCASGGKDGIAMLWEIGAGRNLYTLSAGSQIHALCFSPTRYWLAAATDKNIIIWDLESKAVECTLTPDFGLTPGTKALVPYCTSLAWNHDGTVLITGYTDKKVRVWQVASA